ncbi:hypothetical protein A6A03_04430 [Chloroflexus islandicus]|uniref:Diguanylate cyclase n=1 Tax=Chloroflexus islandicus TaxID=1707952 RepID=A0A178LZU8_9CHLR|nr:diguanylate cyclase [Chloroflexus islandicus]OAN40561.1 hypothetical protein A6A03_04430 [Chloroflexus islandicus]
MSTRAWIYIWSVFITGGGLAGLSLLGLAAISIDWFTFITILLLATLTQLFEAEAPNRQLLYLHFIFFFAALLLLPVPLFVMIVVVPHLVEWLKVRFLTPESPHLRNWYIQPFNIANHIIAGFGALGLLKFGTASTMASSTTTILLYIGAAVTYVLINHLLVGYALQLARGINLQDSGVLSVRSLLPDIIMAGLGCVVAVLWELNPAWLLLALSPVVMMYQALMVPQLVEEARTDTKTGLLNARYFQKAFTREFERAQQSGEPLALIMADLDYLRNINNTYGHLAGDAVISGIGKLIRENLREGDSAGRFGGEEFAIVLPNTDLEAAITVAERLRQMIEQATFPVPGFDSPIRATMSLGVAVFPDDATTMTTLHLAADIAVYQAKEQGRNRVVAAADIPDAIAAGLPTMASQTPAVVSPDITTALSAAPEPPRAAPPVQRAKTVAPASQTTPTPSEAPQRKRRPMTIPTLPALKMVTNDQKSRWLQTYVTVVIMIGAIVALAGMLLSSLTNFWLLVALALIALLFELLQVALNDRSTISVSVAIAVAAAILCGFSGVVMVSSMIALAHTIRQQAPIYRFLFNWSTHLLAGTTFVIIVHSLPKLESLPYIAYLLPVLAIGMPIYFLVDVGLIATAVSLSSGHRLRSIWQSEYSWTFPHYIVLGFIGGFITLAYQMIGFAGIALAVVPLLLARYTQHQYITHTQESIRELRRVNQELRQTNQDLLKANATISRLNQSLVELNDEVVEALARLFDAHDPNSGNHAAQVALYATLLGRALGLEGEQLQQLRWAAFLHDIGKIAIPDAILFKPSKLTQEEYNHIKAHAIIGAELLASSKVTQHIAKFVRQHHERWDGKGYPDGLAGEEISLEARILNLCDSVEAMASDRPYSKGRTPEEIIAEVRACAGTQFDPQIAELFISLVEQYGHDLLVNTAIQRYLDPARSAPEPAPDGAAKSDHHQPLRNQSEVHAT